MLKLSMIHVQEEEEVSRSKIASLNKISSLFMHQSLLRYIIVIPYCKLHKSEKE